MWRSAAINDELPSTNRRVVLSLCPPQKLLQSLLQVIAPIQQGGTLPHCGGIMKAETEGCGKCDVGLTGSRWPSLLQVPCTVACPTPENVQSWGRHGGQATSAMASQGLRPVP